MTMNTSMHHQVGQVSSCAVSCTTLPSCLPVLGPLLPHFTTHSPAPRCLAACQTSAHSSGFFHTPHLLHHAAQLLQGGCGLRHQLRVAPQQQPRSRAGRQRSQDLLIAGQRQRQASRCTAATATATATAAAAQGF